MYKNNTDQRLTDQQRHDLDAEISLTELGEALYKMKSSKTPGCDGLPSEFYKVFWNKLGFVLWHALLHTKETGTLHPSARKGIISLIPKKEKNPMYIKNWRPLTLLNIDQ